MLRSVTLTRRELDLMSILWKLKSATVAEVRGRLVDDLAYPTVLTMLRNLELKGYARHEDEGRAFRYFPVIEPNQAGDSALHRLCLESLPGISRTPREVTPPIADEKISPRELRRIKQLLQQRLKEIDE